MPTIVVTAAVKGVEAWLKFKPQLIAQMSGVASDGTSDVVFHSSSGRSNSRGSCAGDRRREQRREGKMRARWLVTLVGVVALVAPILAPASVAAAGAPRRVVVAITGGDHFIRPGYQTNDLSFPQATITVAQGGRITFVNKTTDGHTIVLVRASDVPKTTAQVDQCALCDAVNGLLFTDPTSKFPGVAQLDGGVKDAETTPDDADVPDAGAIKSAGGQLPPSLGPVLIEDFDTAWHGKTAGDATIIGTGGAAGGPSQRTIVMTAAPGLYHFICTIHPWMQGTIKVVG
jgi:plastocyanin